jgi:hypothetical protein
MEVEVAIPSSLAKKYDNSPPAVESITWKKKQFKTLGEVPLGLQFQKSHQIFLGIVGGDENWQRLQSKFPCLKEYQIAELDAGKRGLAILRKLQNDALLRKFTLAKFLGILNSCLDAEESIKKLAKEWNTTVEQIESMENSGKLEVPIVAKVFFVCQRTNSDRKYCQRFRLLLRL